MKCCMFVLVADGIETDLQSFLFGQIDYRWRNAMWSLHHLCAPGSFPESSPGDLDLRYVFDFDHHL